MQTRVILSKPVSCKGQPDLKPAQGVAVRESQNLGKPVGCKGQAPNLAQVAMCGSKQIQSNPTGSKGSGKPASACGQTQRNLAQGRSQTIPVTCGKTRNLAQGRSQKITTNPTGSKGSACGKTHKLAVKGAVCERQCSKMRFLVLGMVLVMQAIPVLSSAPQTMHGTKPGDVGVPGTKHGIIGMCGSNTCGGPHHAQPERKHFDKNFQGDYFKIKQSKHTDWGHGMIQYMADVTSMARDGHYVRDGKFKYFDKVRDLYAQYRKCIVPIMVEPEVIIRHVKLKESYLDTLYGNHESDLREDEFYWSDKYGLLQPIEDETIDDLADKVPAPHKDEAARPKAEAADTPRKSKPAATKRQSKPARSASAPRQGQRSRRGKPKARSRSARPAAKASRAKTTPETCRHCSKTFRYKRSRAQHERVCKRNTRNRRRRLVTMERLLKEIERAERTA